jgi:hypothetical protein
MANINFRNILYYKGIKMLSAPAEGYNFRFLLLFWYLTAERLLSINECMPSSEEKTKHKYILLCLHNLNTYLNLAVKAKLRGIFH